VRKRTREDGATIGDTRSAWKKVTFACTATYKKKNKKPQPLLGQRRCHAQGCARRPKGGRAQRQNNLLPAKNTELKGEKNGGEYSVALLVNCVKKKWPNDRRRHRRVNSNMDSWAPQKVDIQKEGGDPEAHKYRKPGFGKANKKRDCRGSDGRHSEPVS